MFGIGPTELAFFLVIVLLAVGPDRLPTFMRTVGKGVRQVRNASREFKDAIGLDDLMREGDPFRAPPVRPPRARPVPIPPNPTREAKPDEAKPDEAKADAPPPPPSPEASQRATEPESAPQSAEPEPTAEAETPAEPKHP